MSALIPLAAIASFVIGAVVWTLRENARNRRVARDETLRAGGAAPGTGESAAERALGATAWTRLSDPSGP